LFYRANSIQKLKRERILAESGTSDYQGYENYQLHCEYLLNKAKWDGIGQKLERTSNKVTYDK
jgi:hypothetical protein